MEILASSAAGIGLILCVAVFFTVYFVIRLNSIVASLGEVDKFIDQTKKWKSTTGKILSLGVNVDHEYSELKPDFSNNLSDQLLELEVCKLENMAKRIKLNPMYGGVLIKYRYRVNSIYYNSRQLGALPDPDRDIKRVYKLKYRDKIKVMYNPYNPSQSIIRPTSEETVNDFKFNALFSLWKPGLGFFMSWLMVALAIQF